MCWIVRNGIQGKHENLHILKSEYVCLNGLPQLSFFETNLEQSVHPQTWRHTSDASKRADKEAVLEVMY